MTCDNSVVFSNETDHHDITEILVKVALKHHNPNTQCVTDANSSDD